MRHSIIKKTLSIIKEYDLIKADQTIILAFSGGPDSVALFHILNKIKNAINIKLNILHINHQIRNISIEEERWVSEFGALNGTNTIIKRLESRKTNDFSIEEWAHKKRYKVFNDMCRIYPDSLIATAHHSRDNLETILLSLFKGNMGNPLEGIKIKTANIIRPLLYINKEEIMDFISHFNFNYLVDHTNMDISYDRNYIRHKIIPHIDNRFSGIYNKIEQWTKRYSLQKIFIEKRVQHFLNESLSFTKNIFDLDLADFYHLDDALQYEIIRALLFIIYRDYKIISHNLMDEIIIFIKKRKGKVRLPRNYIIWIEKNTLRIKNPSSL